MKETNKPLKYVQTYCAANVSVLLFRVYNLYFTKLKSRVNLYRNARGKRTVVEREV